MPTPTPGQKEIPLGDWKRFLRVADWFERTIEHGKGVLRPTYGQALIVKTPEGGIDARDGETIFSATCIKCVGAETVIAGEKTLHETDEELIVYNFHTTNVPGDTFVKTALSPNGTRYVEMGGPGGHRVVEFSVISAAPFVDEELPVCTAVLASVENISCGVSTPAIGDEVIIWDSSLCWFTIPLDVLIGASGTAVEMARVGDWDVLADCLDYGTLIGSCWWMVTSLCCTENIYGQ